MEPIWKDARERRQDLVNPAVHRIRPGQEFDQASSPPTSEGRLAQDFSRLRHDEAALVAYLGDHVPNWQRQAARLVLIRTLGVQRARDLCERAFGLGALKLSSDSRPPQEQGLAVRYGLAHVQAIKEALLYLLQDPAHAASELPLELLAASPRVTGETALRELRTAGAEAAHLEQRWRARRPGPAGTLGEAPKSRQPAGPGGRAWADLAQRRAGTILRRELGASADRADPDHPRLEEALRRRGEGEPLPDALRLEMESRFQTDFSGVRIHRDRLAEQAAAAVHARAFTVGEDIFFGAGTFGDDADGRRLLAHELMHVVQGYQGRVASPAGGARLSEPGDQLEREATAAAETFAEARPAAGAAVRREERPAAGAGPVARGSAAAIPGGYVLRDGAPSAAGGNYDKQKLLEAMKAHDAAKAIELVAADPTSGLDDLYANSLYPSFWDLVEGSAPHEGATKPWLSTIFHGYQGKTPGDVWSCKRRLLESQFKVTVWKPGDPQNVNKVAELDHLYDAACKLTMAEVQQASFIADNRAKESAAQSPGTSAVPTPKAEPTPGEKLRAEVIALLREYAGAVEGAPDGKFAKFKDPKSLEATRKSYAAGGTTYTTCIDFMGFVKGNAEKNSGVKLKAPVNANIADPTKGPDAKKALGDAWRPASVGMTERPKAGDIFLLTFAKNVYKDDGKTIKFYKGSFSHMGFIAEAPSRSTDGKTPESWISEDGGQGKAGKYTVSYATEEDKKNKTNPIYTEVQKGQEKILRSERWYLPDKNLISGEPNQDPEARTLLGWVDLEKLVG